MDYIERERRRDQKGDRITPRLADKESQARFREDSKSVSSYRDRQESS